MLVIGDKVKTVYSGAVCYIHNNYITIQFENYKGTMQVNDILEDNSKWVRRSVMYKRVGNKWVEVKEKDLNTRLCTEKYSDIKGRLTKWEW